MGTVPIGTGEWRRMVSRISGMLPPVERSMTVSAPCWMAMWSLRSSSSILEETAELPMLAFTLQWVAMPMPMGSSSGWLMFAGMMRRPAPISSRTSSAETFSRWATYSISSVILPRRAKCICDMLESPVRAASALRFTIHSARGWRISSVALGVRPLVVIVPPGRKIGDGLLDVSDVAETDWDYKLMRLGAHEGWFSCHASFHVIDLNVMQRKSQSIRIGAAVVIILGVIAFLAVSGVRANKSY